ncbi:MAG: hypothetical protein ACP5UZ_07305 [Thermoplasmata archaeon]
MIKDVDKNLMEVVRKTVKEYLESLMRTERDVFIEEHGGLKNGFYERSMKMKYVEIEDLFSTEGQGR